MKGAGGDAAKVILAIVGVYLLFFVAIVIDEIVLETDRLEELIPDSIQPGIVAIYLPLVPLYEWCDRKW